MASTFDDESFVNMMYDRELLFRNERALLAEEMGTRNAALERLTPTEQDFKQMISAAPEKEKEYVASKFVERQKHLEYMKNMHHNYLNLEMGIEKFAEYMKHAYKPDAVQQFIQSNPAYADKIRKPDDLVQLYVNMIKAVPTYAKAWKKAVEKIKKIDYDINKILHVNKYKTETYATKAIPIIISVGFAGLVLYTLSQINPENVTVGAFFAGSNSSVLLTMLSAVVIFLLFFLTHHKLK